MGLRRVRKPVEPCGSSRVACREFAEDANTLPQGKRPGSDDLVVLLLIPRCHHLQYFCGERVSVLYVGLGDVVTEDMLPGQHAGCMCGRTYFTAPSSMIVATARLVTISGKHE